MRRVHPVSFHSLFTIFVVMAIVTVSTADEGSLSSITLTQESMHAEYEPGDLRPDPLEHIAPSRDHDALHLELDLEIDLDNQRIWGSATHTIQILKPGTRRIELNSVGLEIHSVQVGSDDNSRPVAPGMADARWEVVPSLDPFNDMLAVDLGKPAAVGEIFAIRIEYSADDPGYGLFFVQPEGGSNNRRPEVWSQGEGQNNRFWFPGFDYPNDKATYEGIFRVEPGNFVLSNGVLVDEREVDGKLQFHWSLDTPQVNYLVMLAAGEYEVHRENHSGVELLYVVPPGTGAETVERCYGVTRDVLDVLGEVTGTPYPYKKYAQVVVQNFIFGGMENTTATVMNERSLFDERTMLTRDAESLIAHELAHQWWGDMVTLREWTHMWLNEGFATYFQKLYEERAHGEDQFRLALYSTHEGLVGRDNSSPLPMVVDFYNRVGDRSNANVYSKGSSVLHMLRQLLGDEVFFAVIKQYGAEHAFGFADTADFARVIKDVSGENLDWFFEQWVYLAGHPELKASKSWDEKARLLTLKVEQTQEVKGLVPLFRLPVDIEITTDAGAKVYSVVLENKSQEYYFNLDSKPKMVIFDKGDWILKSLEFSKPKGELLYQLEHGDAVSRVRAIGQLGKKTSEAEVRDALAGVIQSEQFYGVRQAAVNAITESVTDETYAILKDALDVDNARVRLTVVQRASRYKDRPALQERLMGILLEDVSYAIRASAVDSLVTLKSELAEDACLEAISQDSDRHDVRNAGIHGLRKLKATGQLDTILEFTGPGNSRWYRHTAISTAASLALETKDEDTIQRVAGKFAPMLDDWYVRTREAASRALDKLGVEGSVNDLRVRAQIEKVPWVAKRMEAAANAIETRSPKEDNSLEDLAAKVKGLQDSIQELEEQLEALAKKVGEPEVSP